MHFKSTLATGIAVAIIFVAAGAAQERPPDGVVPPAVVKEVKPVYTPDARKAGIEGKVVMDAVVLEDGTVGDVKVTQSLDDQYGLDEEAIKAVKQWRFRPGTKDGKPVPVSVFIEMSFTLK